MLKKLRAVVVCHVLAFGCFACVSSASAAVTGPLDGETLVGTPGSQYTTIACDDNGDGTTYLYTRSRGGVGFTGVATGPVTGTFDRGGVGATFDTTTGSVTDFEAGFRINDALGNQAYAVDVTLGAGHGVGSCTASSYSLTVTDATYTAYDNTGAVSGTGVVSLSVTFDPATGVGTLTASFGPQLPTTTDQCKKGGYKAYPGFKNQGDCVSYVATKGKNTPAGR